MGKSGRDLVFINTENTLENYYNNIKIINNLKNKRDYLIENRDSWDKEIDQINDSQKNIELQKHKNQLSANIMAIESQIMELLIKNSDLDLIINVYRDNDRKIIEMRYSEKKYTREICDNLKISENSFYKRNHKIITDITKKLG